MTRETKIGLLVGLAFIIVIGILLSDHLTTSNEPTQASLQRVGTNVREGVTVPGAGNAPPVRIVSPEPVSPGQQVPTRQELTPAPQPPIKMAENTTPSPVTINPPVHDLPPAPAPRSDVGPVVNNVDTSFGADAPDVISGRSGLRELATRHGEEIVGLVTGTPSASLLPGQKLTVKSYVVQPGDTINKIAARQMGANTKANREAFLAANPSLKGNPNLIVAGKTYVVPLTAEVAPTSPSIANVVPQPAIASETTKPAEMVRASGQPEYWYTVKPGDTLWRIASNQLGDAKAIASIKELNRDALKGSDKITANMKLRLPARPVASAE